MKKLIVITGPTASGKTKIAINLASKINGEIISADSRCVYEGLDIVSAKPTPEEREGVLHHLFDIRKPLDDPYSAGDFVHDAQICIEEITSRGKAVIITGGTWFYIKCLLDERLLPEIGQNKELRNELEQYDTEKLRQMLEELDKKRAEEIHPNNRERIIRAIEMARSIGCSGVYNAQRKENKLEALWFTNKFSKEQNREELYKRINFRVDEMIKAGLYFEFEKMTKKYGRTKVLENTIGYREFFELNDGVYKTFEEAVEKIKQRTRNFAKRQLTYFKTEKRLNFSENAEEIVLALKNHGFWQF